MCDRVVGARAVLFFLSLSQATAPPAIHEDEDLLARVFSSAGPCSCGVSASHYCVFASFEGQ
jgi:hypothetical protein